MKFTEKLSQLISEQRLNRKQFSEKASIPYSTIDNWYKRGYENMSISLLRTICDFFNVTMDSMAFDDREIEYRAPREIKLTTQEADLISKYRKLDNYGTQMVESVINIAFLQATDEKESESNEQVS